MGNGGGETVFEPENCKSLDKKNKEPSENERVNRLLGKDEVTTAAATVKPKCELLGDPLIGSSGSGTLRSRFKSLINGPNTNREELVNRGLESLGNIVLSPPRTMLNAGDITFCKGVDEEKKDVSKKLGDRDCHAEVSILSSLSRSGCLNKDSKILLNINWSRNKETPKMPCETCKGIMDDIVANCDVTIEICGQSGEPKPVNPEDNYDDFAEEVMNKTNDSKDAMEK